MSHYHIQISPQFTKYANVGGEKVAEILGEYLYKFDQQETDLYD